VWDLAKRYYAKDALRGKSAPAAALHPIVQQAFVDAFGPYAGWAHNALFVSCLPAFQARIRRAAKGRAAGKEALMSSDGDEDEDDEGEGEGDRGSDFALRTPAPKTGKSTSSSGGGGGNKKRPSAASVAREERRRRRSGQLEQEQGGDDGVPLPFESLLS
jgi:hypothetical protein